MAQTVHDWMPVERDSAGSTCYWKCKWLSTAIGKWPNLWTAFRSTKRGASAFCGGGSTLGVAIRTWINFRVSLFNELPNDKRSAENAETSDKANQIDGKLEEIRLAIGNYGVK